MSEELRPLLVEQMGRLEDAWEGRIVLYIERRDEEYFLDPDFPESVYEAFPDVRLDVEEAGKCVALERYSASGFHSFRVLERGLKYAGKKLVPVFASGKEDVDRCPWGVIAQKMKAAGAKMLKGANGKEELETIVSWLTPIKEFWRDQQVHLSEMERLDRREALLVFGTVAKVMEYVAGVVRDGAEGDE